MPPTQKKKKPNQTKKNPQTSKAMQMLKYCIKTHLVPKQDFELSAENMLLMFLTCVFKADKYQSSEQKSHVNVSAFGEELWGSPTFTVMHFPHADMGQSFIFTLKC